MEVAGVQWRGDPGQIQRGMVENEVRLTEREQKNLLNVFRGHKRSTIPPPLDLNYGSIKKYLNIQWSIIIANLQSMNADVRLTELLHNASPV